MVTYSSRGTGYQSNSSTAKIAYSSSSSSYSVNSQGGCCGSFSRGQRCSGCPNK